MHLSLWEDIKLTLYLFYDGTGESSQELDMGGYFRQESLDANSVEKQDSVIHVAINMFYNNSKMY